ITAAYISPQNGLSQPGALHKLQALVDRLNTDGAAITLVTHTAPTIARGILDLATEHNADMLVLGVRAQASGRLVLGPVVEEVARTAPQHVVIYRGSPARPFATAFDEILVPVNGQPPSTLAGRIGLQMVTPAGSLRFTAYGSEAHARYYQTTLQTLEQVRQEQQRAATIHPERAPHLDLVEGVLAQATPDNLVIMGVSEKDYSLDNWLTWDVPRRLLNEIPGPVLLVKQSAREETSVRMRLAYWLHDFMPTLTPREHARVVQEGDILARSNATFYTLVLLSSLIASLGLLQNSTAVIIGAMLIAPLMAPLMGFALGLTQGKPHLMQEAIFTILKAILLVLVLTALLGTIWPVKTPTDEMLARGTPSLLDMLVAMFSGAVGAYALARKEVSSTLAGVSIAAALMPPLCTVGMAYAAGETRLASGAFLLFLTNIVSISLAAAGMFVWMGVRLRLRNRHTPRQNWRLALSLGTLLLLAIPLSMSLGHWVQTANRLNTAWVTLREIYGSSTVMDIELREQDDTISVIATVRVPREIFGYELTDAHRELLTQGQQLLRERMASEQVLLFVDAQPLFSVPGEAPPGTLLTDGTLGGMLRRVECASQPEGGQCSY
ncbi:MAG: TIGR00341 family protein, partial [Anaerolineae bacterium]|nr:TIGR00341 family protein [Anaerolineae bacterium]